MASRGIRQNQVQWGHTLFDNMDELQSSMEITSIKGKLWGDVGVSGETVFVKFFNRFEGFWFFLAPKSKPTHSSAFHSNKQNCSTLVRPVVPIILLLFILVSIIVITI